MMNQMDIAFPNLGIYLENVPQAFYIGDFRIALYGCMIALGMMLGILMAAQVAKKTGQSPDTYWDISVWLIIFSLIGARIYYVIFFWDAYKDNLLQIFNFRAGGLAIYGGVIGGILTAYVYCLIKKKFLPEILDTAVYGLLVGQIIGRWGNFFNREVFGGYTDGLLAMRLPISMVRDRDITSELAAHIADGTNYIQVHPTFLYEGLWNLGLLILLLLFLKHLCEGVAETHNRERRVCLALFRVLFKVVSAGVFSSGITPLSLGLLAQPLQQRGDVCLEPWVILALWLC